MTDIDPPNPEDELQLDQPSDFDAGYEMGITQALALVRPYIERTSRGGELRYPELRALEAELSSLLDE